MAKEIKVFSSLTLRVPPELREWIAKAAERRGEGVNAIAVKMLEAGKASVK